jgi:hypothetical protein
MKRCYLLSCLLLGVPSANAEPFFLNGNQLLSMCEERAGSAGQFQCIGFLQGVHDTIAQTRWAFGVSPCLSMSVNVYQVRDVVVRYLKDYAQIRHGTAAGLASEAITRAWCSNDSPTVSRIPEEPKPKWEPVPVKKPAKPLPLDTDVR